jgi:hypothetical protein
MDIVRDFKVGLFVLTLIHIELAWNALFESYLI